LIYPIYLSLVYLRRNYEAADYYIPKFSNLEVLEKFQSKVLRIIIDTPWYVPNPVIKRDLQVLSVRQEV